MKAIDLYIANHLRLADEDLKAAQVLIKAGNRFGAYHAEQAAEKILLALITSEQTHVKRKDAHRLDVLRDKLPDENPFKARFRSLVYLTAYATTTFRYPEEGGRLPAQEEIDEGVAKIKSILDDAVKHFGIDIDASDNVPAKNPAPPRIQ
jgi:HEPN domain-containing protein